MRTVRAAAKASRSEADSVGNGRLCAIFAAHDSSPPTAPPSSQSVVFGVFCSSGKYGLVL